MQFNSVQYIIFLPCIVLLYYIIPHKVRWALLLAGSYYFYMCWRVEYIFLIIGSTIVDYYCGLQMSKIINKKKKLPYLVVSLVVNLGLLFMFKYYNFALDTANSIFKHFNIAKDIPHLKVLLPVGISFYTFQTLSYTIEVFQGNAKAERHLGYFALYVAFFPQLVAGPIERFTRLSPQLKMRHYFNYDNLAKGFRLIIYGLFIKMVIADNLSVYVDQIYNAPSEFSSLSILTGIIFYSFQIYSDFYGYSLIAIGSAQLLGIELMDNFNTPYLSRNINEFWQRWHISLSTWFRDYLYIPLGGNKVKLSRWIINIIIVFVLSGMWHGANWTFIIWGGIFGVSYIIEKLFNEIFRLPVRHGTFKLWHVILVIKNFVIVSIAWIFFRSENLGKVSEIFHALKSNIGLQDNFMVKPHVWAFFFVFILSDIIVYNSRFDDWTIKRPATIRWAFYTLLLFAIIIYSGVENFPFIYFQF